MAAFTATKSDRLGSLLRVPQHQWHAAKAAPSKAASKVSNNCTVNHRRGACACKGKLAAVFCKPAWQARKDVGKRKNR
eukprot:scaffold132535_cov19-Tisochrysis_lutea.AAC.3